MVYNTLTQTEMKILEFFTMNIEKQFTIREIARQIKTSYPITHECIQKLANKNLIMIEKQGKSKLCSFNYKRANQDVFYTEQIEAGNLLQKNKNLNVLVNDIKLKIGHSFYILLLFGSFAKGTQNKQSDIDLLMIIPESENIEKFESKIHSIISIYPLEIHLTIINEKSFIEMLAGKDVTNVAKEVLNNHIILYGIENYYKLIATAK
jgi:predicted nucleotidyltransferase/predicted transcriptional regulator